MFARVKYVRKCTDLCCYNIVTPLFLFMRTLFHESTISFEHIPQQFESDRCVFFLIAEPKHCTMFEILYIVQLDLDGEPTELCIIIVYYA